jgi:DNA-binding MarR family transcriptional regulator
MRVINLETKQIYELVWCTRRLFQQLRATSDELLEGTGINTSQRAVLEFLSKHQPQTVSSMARERDVSRQHIQLIVNSLLEVDLVEARDNPAHKRSPLISITEKGDKLFAEIILRETKVLDAMAGQFGEKNISASIRTLKAMRDYLKSQNAIK